MAFKFEKLEVWKESVELSYKIHQLTSSFPNEEDEINSVYSEVDNLVMRIQALKKSIT